MRAFSGISVGIFVDDYVQEFIVSKIKTTTVNLLFFTFTHTNKFMKSNWVIHMSGITPQECATFVTLVMNAFSFMNALAVLTVKKNHILDLVYFGLISLSDFQSNKNWSSWPGSAHQIQKNAAYTGENCPKIFKVRAPSNRPWKLISLNKASERLSLFFSSAFLPIHTIFYVGVCVCVDCPIDWLMYYCTHLGLSYAWYYR